MYSQVNSEDLMKEVYLRGPVTITFHNQIEQFYKGGIFDCTSVIDTMFSDVQLRIIEALSYSYSPVDHCVLVVGWGTTADGIDYWLLQNSQGVSFGDNGFFKIKRGNNECGIESMVDVVYAE